MDFLPVFMKVKGRTCLVVGAGEVALRKASVLLSAGASVRVVAPAFCAEFAALAGVECIHARFAAVHLDGVVLVIAATDDRAVNFDVSQQARLLNIPVNVVDSPELCSFIMPSILDRSPLVVAFSSGGASPVLARMLRATLETMIPARYGHLAQFCADMRDTVKARISTAASRRIFWENALDGVIAEKVLAGDAAGAKAQLMAQLDDTGLRPQGEVYLVGAGPGDPDLLTFRALRLMQKADVVVYDNLVSAQILDMTRRDAARIFVGKQRDNHTLPQQEINALLVKLAMEGRRVVRLKGGDPFIFGRGGEEIETLSEHGIPFQVVPGITAASGVSAYAGIPLTHRDYAQSVIFTTGHLKEGVLDLDWEALCRPGQTVVIYMGLGALAEICRQMMAHGLIPDWPAAVVMNGTQPDQVVVVGTLQTLADKVAGAGLKSPCLIIIGEVVKLRDTLSWC